MSKKKAGIEDFMSKSSLFKNEKNKMHSSYITHQQYFSEMKDQRISHSHLNYINASPLSKLSPASGQSLLPYSAHQYSDMKSKSLVRQEKYSQIYPDKKLQSNKTQQKVQKEKHGLVESVERRIREMEELEKQRQAQKRIEKNQTEKKGQDEKLNQYQIIQEEQEPHLAETTSQQLQELNLSPSRKFYSPDYDYHTIDIFISPDPKLRNDRPSKQITDNFVQTSSQIFSSQKDQSARKESKGVQFNNYQNQNTKLQAKNLWDRKNRSYNYSQMSLAQSSKKYQALRNGQNRSTFSKKYHDQILNEPYSQKMYRNRNYDIQDLNKKIGFFSVTQREAQNYVNSIQLQLKEANLSLSNIQAQIDSLMLHNLEVQCQKIRTIVTRAIENSLNRFREAQKRRLQNSKMQFIAELYQIQSSLELRRQEVQKLKYSFQKQNQWKHTVSQLLTNNFQQNVGFLIAKSHEIESQWLITTNQFLVSYNHSIQQNVQKGIKNDIQNIIEAAFSRFSSQKEGSPHKKYKPQYQIQESGRHKPLD